MSFYATSNQKGFTFMEIIITILVAAILMTLAVPSFRAAIQNNRLTGEANEIIAAFQFARSEALKRGAPVQVCSSSNGISCGGNWNQGWIALAELPGNATELLRAWPGNGNDFSFTPANGTVRYLGTGFYDALAPFTMDVTLPDCLFDNARQIVVEPSGRAASERTSC
ncbi:MAG: GspH/FimT family pseudopilin [Pseudomonadota bacterium]